MRVLTGEHWTIYVDDVLAGLRQLPSKSVHCCVTSPPYWNLREYGFAGQIGQERSPEEFVAALMGVFREVNRVLRDDGVLFVNLGDSFADDSKWGGATGIPAGNKIGIPWRFALAMQADGWILRQDVIWSKPAPMPESVSGWRWVPCRVKVASAPVTLNGDYASTAHSNPQTGLAGHSGNATNGAKYIPCPGCDKCQDNGGMVLRRGSWRPTTSHEYIFQFVKTQNYFCDGDGSKEKAVGGTPGNVNHKGKTAYESGDRHHMTKVGLCDVGAVETRNVRSVWNAALRSAELKEMASTLKRALLAMLARGLRSPKSIWKLSPEGFKGAHFACFPSELPHRCLKAATSRGGCCSACGCQYAPVVESKRTATRPGTNSKVNRVSCHDESPYQDHSGDICGNRDPQRHTTTTVVTGYRATCSCNATAKRPVVLDCFGGSMTTGQVAINMGCEFIGLEGNLEYAQLGVTRLETPWAPKSDKKPTKPRRKKHRLQKEMF